DECPKHPVLEALLPFVFVQLNILQSNETDDLPCVVSSDIADLAKDHCSIKRLPYNERWFGSVVYPDNFTCTIASFADQIDATKGALDQLLRKTRRETNIQLFFAFTNNS